MDSFSKIPPNRFLSCVTGVTEVSNPFDALGLLADDILSDEDSSTGDPIDDC